MLLFGGKTVGGLWNVPKNLATPSSVTAPEIDRLRCCCWDQVHSRTRTLRRNGSLSPPPPPRTLQEWKHTWNCLFLFPVLLFLNQEEMTRVPSASSHLRRLFYVKRSPVRQTTGPLSPNSRFGWGFETVDGFMGKAQERERNREPRKESRLIRSKSQVFSSSSPAEQSQERNTLIRLSSLRSSFFQQS